METLGQWIWPGNIRELENFIERFGNSDSGLSFTSSIERIECRAEQRHLRNTPGKGARTDYARSSRVQRATGRPWRRCGTAWTEAHYASVQAYPFWNRSRRLSWPTRGEERLTAYPQWAYPGLMTPRFKRILEAAVWFVAGFVTHLLMRYYHHVG